MNYIKSLHIEGFKKFTSLDVQFNEHMNILVGENEAGKSTILDAIKTVLNQQYRNADRRTDKVGQKGRFRFERGCENRSGGTELRVNVRER